MHYREIWELANDKEIPAGCEIHHIDGNRKNNNIENLKMVTIAEHCEIHKQQHDWGAVQAIFMRMDVSPEERSEAASKAQKKLLAEGRHNWQKVNRKKLSKKTMRKRKKAGLPAFLGIKNTTENARKAGQAARAKSAGFLNAKSKNHGSKHVKGTFWWVNKKGERVRAKTSPGPTWKKGMKFK